MPFNKKHYKSTTFTKSLHILLIITHKLQIKQSEKRQTETAQLTTRLVWQYKTRKANTMMIKLRPSYWWEPAASWRDWWSGPAAASPLFCSPHLPGGHDGGGSVRLARDKPTRDINAGRGYVGQLDKVLRGRLDHTLWMLGLQTRDGREGLRARMHVGVLKQLGLWLDHLITHWAVMYLAPYLLNMYLWNISVWHTCSCQYKPLRLFQ